MRKIRVVLISSYEAAYLNSIVEYMKRNELDVEIVLVISNYPNSEVIAAAASYDVPRVVIDHTKYLVREEHDRQVMAALEYVNPDIIILAGYHRLFVLDELFEKYSNIMVNVHLSFLPDFKGLKPWEDAFYAGVRESGYTIHRVVREMDEGRILQQESVSVENCTSVNSVYEKLVETASKGLCQFLKSQSEILGRNL